MELETELEVVAEVEPTPAPVEEAPAEVVEVVEEAPAPIQEAPKAKKSKTFPEPVQEAPAPIQEVANPARIQVQGQGIVIARSIRNN